MNEWCLLNKQKNIIQIVGQGEKIMVGAVKGTSV
jgi:hypothetical protein